MVNQRLMFYCNHGASMTHSCCGSHRCLFSSVVAFLRSCPVLVLNRVVFLLLLHQDGCFFLLIFESLLLDFADWLVISTARGLIVQVRELLGDGLPVLTASIFAIEMCLRHVAVSCRSGSRWAARGSRRWTTWVWHSCHGKHPRGRRPASRHHWWHAVARGRWDHRRPLQVRHTRRRPEHPWRRWQHARRLVQTDHRMRVMDQAEHIRLLTVELAAAWLRHIIVS